MEQKKRSESFITFNFTFSIEAENFRGIGKSLVGWVVAISLVVIKIALSLARDGP